MKNILLFCMLLGVSSAALDLKRSIDRIKAQIDVTKQEDTAPKWDQLPAIIEKALPCLSLLGVFEVNSDRLPRNLENYIEGIIPFEFAQQLLKVNWDEVSAKRSEIKPNTVWDDLKKFMNTTQFVTIHKHIWGNDEFLDLIGYLHDANYAEIYTVIKGLYTLMERADLIVDIPDAPPTYPLVQSAKKVARNNNAPKTSSNNFPMITMKSSIFKAEETCNLLGLLATLNASQIQHVIKIFLFTLQELIGNAAVHILCLKIGETQKGEFFHETLALPEMQGFFPIVQGAILQDPAIAQLNEILKQVTGLDLANAKLFNYIVELVQYLVWNYPFSKEETP